MSEVSEKFLQRFTLQIKEGSELLRKCSGGSEDWQSCVTLSVPGFNGSANIDLSDIWLKVLKNKQTHYKGSVTATECIIKFGDTMLYKKQLTLVLKVQY